MSTSNTGESAAAGITVEMSCAGGATEKRKYAVAFTGQPRRSPTTDNSESRIGT